MSETEHQILPNTVRPVCLRDILITQSKFIPYGFQICCLVIGGGWIKNHLHGPNAMANAVFVNDVSGFRWVLTVFRDNS